jgi:hypothetical protein
MAMHLEDPELTGWASRYVVPPDQERLARAVVADVISTTILSLDLKCPQVTAGQREGLTESERRLMAG